MAKASHKERLLKELKEIREELLETARQIKPEEFDWRPRPDMKSAKDLLQEIGTMEKRDMLWLTTGQLLKWNEVVHWSGDNLESTLAELKKIHQETLKFLESLSDADLDEERTLHGGREGPVTAAIEEVLHWLVRHEYYHLGQLIYNRWLLGYNPYKQS